VGRDPPRPHPQLRTRPPTDDAALRRPWREPDRRHSGESAESMRAVGTLIHHAAARAIGPLVVAMIEPPFRTLLVAPAGGTHAGPTTVGPACRGTIGVSPIAGRTNAKGLRTCSARAHPKRRLHEAAAPSARPRPAAAVSGRMKGDWFGLPQRRVGHEGLEVALQVLTPRSAADTLPHIPSPGRTARARPAQSIHSNIWVVQFWRATLGQFSRALKRDRPW